MPEANSLKNSLQSEPMLDVDKKIMRAYQAGLDSFDAGNWDAAIAACGKALEGMARNELPYNERGGTLGQLLEKLPKYIKPEQPMVELAAAIKDPKGLGGHFDLEEETSEEIARATLSLVDSFINYVYMFRLKVEHLKGLVDGSVAPAVQESQEAGRQTAAAAPSVEAPAKAENSSPENNRLESNRPDSNKPDSGARFDNFDSKSDPFELPAGSWRVGKDA